MEKFLKNLKSELRKIKSSYFIRTISKSQLVCETALMALAGDSYYLVRGAVAANPKTPLEALRKLAEDEYTYIRRNAALNPRLSEEERIRLLNANNGDVRCAAASALTTQDLIITCARREDYYLRCGAAANPLLPEEERRALLDDKIDFVRREAAANLTEDVDLFRRLARYDDFRIRFGLAGNPRLTDPETAEILSSDDECSVRSNLAFSGSRAADHVRMKLAFDSDPIVSWNALANLAYEAEEIREIIENEDEVRKRREYLAYLSSNRRLSASALDAVRELIRKNRAKRAIKHLASNPSIGKDLGLNLAESKSAYTLMRLLANPSQSNDMFIKLLNNQYLRKGLEKSKYDLSEEVTRFFLHPHIDLELAATFSLMLRGTRYEPFDTAFVLREDSLAKGADHQTVRTFFSEKARIVHELLCPLTIEEKTGL